MTFSTWGNWGGTFAGFLLGSCLWMKVGKCLLVAADNTAVVGKTVEFAVCINLLCFGDIPELEFAVRIHLLCFGDIPELEFVGMLNIALLEELAGPGVLHKGSVLV